MLKFLEMNKFCIIALITLLFSLNNFAQKLDGEKIFKANCASCHSEGTNKIVGPGLSGVLDRVPSKEWFIKWVKNSQQLINSGDEYAVKIFEEYNKIVMPPSQLSDEEINAILSYLENYQKKSSSKESTTGATSILTGKEKKKSKDNTLTILLSIIVIILIALLFVLRKTKILLYKTLEQKGKEIEFNYYDKFTDAIKNWIIGHKKTVALVIIIFISWLSVLAYKALMGIGVYQGYKPIQPIKFSHKIHAGFDKIDCQYCHSSASKSRHAGIPSANICMNCHKYIQGEEGETIEYDGEQIKIKDEIAKIYKALDYDPVTQKYGKHTKNIEWIKVHNLPDFVYFNHSQHVELGKIKCQTCHGEVEKMDIVEQFAPLTMGWCIDCHRKTEVKDKNNGYYEEFHNRLTEDLKKRYMLDGKITVDEIGGLECAKCHY